MKAGPLSTACLIVLMVTTLWAGTGGVIKVGWKGRIDVFIVREIVDEATMLVVARRFSEADRDRGGPARSFDMTVLLSGIASAGHAEEEGIIDKREFEVIGTRKHREHTYFEMKPLAR